jgi:hypothetical protein
MGNFKLMHPIASAEKSRGKAEWGTEMKYFQTEYWNDSGNHVVFDARRNAVHSHRATRQRLDGETRALSQKVAKAAAIEASYQSAPEKIRIAKVAFSTVRGTVSPQPNELMQLIFDSFSQPAPPGTRSASMLVRQMLYRAEPYQIHIQIELQRERNRLAVTGQLVDLTHPEMVGREVQVMLSDGAEDVVKTVTNQFGEFRGEVRNSGDLEISFPGREGKPVTILLRGTLDPLSGTKE